MFEHSAHDERFYYKKTEPLDELADLLLNEVLAPIGGHNIFSSHFPR